MKTYSVQVLLRVDSPGSRRLVCFLLSRLRSNGDRCDVNNYCRRHDAAWILEASFNLSLFLSRGAFGMIVLPRMLSGWISCSTKYSSWYIDSGSLVFTPGSSTKSRTQKIGPRQSTSRVRTDTASSKMQRLTRCVAQLIACSRSANVDTNVVGLRWAQVRCLLTASLNLPRVLNAGTVRALNDMLPGC